MKFALKCILAFGISMVLSEKVANATFRKGTKETLSQQEARINKIIKAKFEGGSDKC